MRQGASFSYDASRDVAWLYGGLDSTNHSLGDVWKVDLSGAPTASPVTTAATTPAARAFQAAAYDPVPGRLELASRGANPVAGDVTLSFSLPAQGAGSLDLLDVSGRLVRSARTDGLSPGTHALTLASHRELRAGIYFARLRHAGRERALRLVVLR